MRAKRTDATHSEVLQTLRRLGWVVIDTHAMPGFVDLVAYRRDCGVRLVEVKTERGGYTATQIRMAADGWPVHTLRSADDAINLR